MTDDERKVTRAALDLFARVLCGQIEAVPEVIKDYYVVSTRNYEPLTLEMIDELRAAIGHSKSALNLPTNGSRGIYNPDVHPAARMALGMAEDIAGHGSGGSRRSLTKEADAKWAERWGKPWFGNVK